MRDTPVRGPIVPPIAEATRQLMTPAPAAPERYTPIVRSPRRRPKDSASPFAKG
jgi:hypothetical protein